MTRQLRNNVALFFFALCPASFGAHLWLFYRYFSARPSHPIPELGLVHPLSNHGAYVYISDGESTGLAFLFGAFLVGFTAAVGIVPKKLIFPRPSTPRWITYLPSFETDLANPTPTRYVVMAAAFMFHLAIIIFAGRSIVSFAVSHGIILSW
jgi:hypothetical protein